MAALDEAETELASGASVSLRAGDGFGGAHVTLVHEPEEPNLIAGIERGRPLNASRRASSSCRARPNAQTEINRLARSP